ncbi:MULTISPECIES: VanZ family protein [unclassified Tolypothrix]|uniref:VanZ family protein n=1 Tax=unclassified Tolypothrix TaxID=2649714 RepID=UPI0005F8846A|nr:MULTISPECIES: VanZ family protein [unclassified Tolypothrix]MBE9082902.1 VanZ family protein [Tolypothrix sp. LEGE 11397]UYD27240.1 VanZ family protein [Tolypothrix sp. PCC 7712]UYD36901.1 VanZ family protein [Tolypothrix sp. PCC 7601]
MKANRFWVFAFWVYFGILMSISLSAYLKIIPTELAQFPHYDTILHFLLLGIAAFISHLAGNKRKIQILNISLPLAPMIVILICVIDEIIQFFVPYRSFDLFDLTADLCGIVFFTWLAERKKLKTS